MCPDPREIAPGRGGEDRVVDARTRISSGRPSVLALAGALALFADAQASPTLLTISCEPPKGTSTVYGITTSDLLDSIGKHEPTPAPKLYAGRPDGYPKTIITIHADGTAAVTLDFPHNLGGTETHDMQLLGRLNEYAITLLSDVGLGDSGAQLVTFYPQQSIAFFAGNTYTGYIGKDGVHGDTLFSYSFFAHCQFDGIERLRQVRSQVHPKNPAQ